MNGGVTILLCKNGDNILPENYNLIKVVVNTYSANNIQARTDGEPIESIPVEKGIGQGNSLSPLFFNVIMDEILKQVRLKGYKMGDRNITILYQAEDAVLVAENEDDLCV